MGEAGGVTNATLGTTTASGTLTDTDVDDMPNTFTAVTSPTKPGGTHFVSTPPSLPLPPHPFPPPPPPPLGTNDAAIISGTTTGTVIEAGGVPATRHADRDRNTHRHRRR